MSLAPKVSFTDWKIEFEKLGLDLFNIGNNTFITD